MTAVVQCYGCGTKYEPTPEETHRHTHHAQAEAAELAGDREVVASMLEECQRERDELARAQAQPAPHLGRLPGTAELLAESARLYHYDAEHHAAVYAAAHLVDLDEDRRPSAIAADAASVALTIARHHHQAPA